MKFQSGVLAILFIATVAWAAESNDHDSDKIAPEDHEVPEETLVHADVDADEDTDANEDANEDADAKTNSKYYYDSRRRTYSSYSYDSRRRTYSSYSYDSRRRYYTPPPPPTYYDRRRRFSSYTPPPPPAPKTYRGFATSGAAMGCYHARPSDYPNCVDYKHYNYACVGDNCAAMNPGGTPWHCAKKAPEGSFPDPTTGLCTFPKPPPPMSHAATGCWQAFLPYFTKWCEGYSKYGYTCDSTGQNCAAMNPGGTPMTCARPGPKGSIVKNGKCVKPASKPLPPKPEPSDKCGMSTPLKSGTCCDRKTRRIVEGSQMMSYRWCRTDPPKPKPPPVAALPVTVCDGTSDGGERDTGGTCNFLGCDESRGDTECKPMEVPEDMKGLPQLIKDEWDKRCFCKPGFCAQNGKCVQK